MQVWHCEQGSQAAEACLLMASCSPSNATLVSEDQLSAPIGFSSSRFCFGDVVQSLTASICRGMDLHDELNDGGQVSMIDLALHLCYQHVLDHSGSRMAEIPRND